MEHWLIATNFVHFFHLTTMIVVNLINQFHLWTHYKPQLHRKQTARLPLLQPIQIYRPQLHLKQMMRLLLMPPMPIYRQIMSKSKRNTKMGMKSLLTLNKREMKRAALKVSMKAQLTTRLSKLKTPLTRVFAIFQRKTILPLMSHNEM